MGELRAKRAGDATAVLDLCWGGSTWPMDRFLRLYAVDPRTPSGRYSVPASGKPRALLAGMVAFLVVCVVLLVVCALALGISVLGALTR